MKILSIDQLKPADVLIFSGADDSISKAIMWLTNSQVTHAALYYTEKGRFIEQTPPSIRFYHLNPDDERFQGRKIYVNRLEIPQASMMPVMNPAIAYLNQETPYANNNLYTLGLILLYKKFRPNTLVKKVMMKIYKKLAVMISDYINKRQTPGKSPMVCSEFVYQCFEDAGEDYQLHIRKGSLIDQSLSLSENNLSALDRTIDRVKDDSSRQFQGFAEISDPLAIENPPSQTEEELAQELIEALSTSKVEIAEELDNELALAVHEFGQATYSAEGTTENATSLMLANTNKFAKELNISSALSFLKAKEAFFVTPEDLLNNCDNLTQVGILKL